MTVHLPEEFSLSVDEWGRTPHMLKKIIKDIYDTETVVKVYNNNSYVEIAFKVKE